MRSVGFVANPIALSEIVAWLDLHGIYGTESRLFYFHLVRSLDIVWLTRARKQSEEKPSKSSKEPSKGSRTPRAPKRAPRGRSK